MIPSKTTFRVAHRLSEVAQADLILVLQDGVITQRGTHESLVVEPGWYRDVFLLQSPENGTALAPERRFDVIRGGAVG